jgi:hypothetical protein
MGHTRITLGLTYGLMYITSGRINGSNQMGWINGSNQWAGTNGSNQLGRIKWAKSIGLIQMGQINWAESNGPSQLSQYKWAESNGPIQMDQIKWAGLNGPPNTSNRASSSGPLIHWMGYTNYTLHPLLEIILEHFFKIISKGSFRPYHK